MKPLECVRPTPIRHGLCARSSELRQGILKIAHRLDDDGKQPLLMRKCWIQHLGGCQDAQRKSAQTAFNASGGDNARQPVQNALGIAAIPKWVEHQIIQAFQPFPAYTKQVGGRVDHLYRERIEQPGFRLKVCGLDLSNQAGYLRAVNVVRIEQMQKTFCQVAGQGFRSWLEGVWKRFHRYLAKLWLVGNFAAEPAV